MCCDKYEPQSIIALLRGGVVPGRIFSDYFNIFLDFFALDVKLYDTIGVRNEVAKIKPFNGNVKGKKILVIDDIWDSGTTMQAVLEYLGEEDVTTATIFWKETATSEPTYYSEKVEEDTWIVFPWETYEFWRDIKTQ